MLSDLIKIGLGTAIIKLQTTVSLAGEDIFVDMAQVPAGYVRLLQNFAMTPDSNLSATENITPFVCDATMAPNTSPLKANGRLDLNKTGVAFNSWSVGLANPFSIESSPVGFIAALAAGQFIRFSSSSITGPFPAIGDFANIQVLYSDIHICDPSEPS